MRKNSDDKNTNTSNIITDKQEVDQARISREGNGNKTDHTENGPSI